MKTKLSIVLLVTVIWSGCASYQHTRTNADGAKETTGISTLFMTSKASKINSLVKDGEYSRRVGVGDISGTGDAETIKAIFEAGMAVGKKAVIP